MTEEKQKLLDTLLRQTVMMRNAQINYYRIIRSGAMESIRKNAMFTAKEWEGKVDKTIEQINQLPQTKLEF